MAHFAELNENNEVLRVVVVHNAELLDENGQEYATETARATSLKK